MSTATRRSTITRFLRAIEFDRVDHLSSRHHHQQPPQNVAVVEIRKATLIETGVQTSQHTQRDILLVRCTSRRTTKPLAGERDDAREIAVPHSTGDGVISILKLFQHDRDIARLDTRLIGIRRQRFQQQARTTFAEFNLRDIRDVRMLTPGTLDQHSVSTDTRTVPAGSVEKDCRMNSGNQVVAQRNPALRRAADQSDTPFVKDPLLK